MPSISVETHDLGADGAAQRARLVRQYAVAGRSTGSASPGVAVVVPRYRDTTLHDRMHRCAQLSDRQHRSACVVHGLWVTFQSRVTAKYQDAGIDPHVDDTAESSDYGEDETPRDRYRVLMASVSLAHADAVENLMREWHPGVGHLATLQSALSAVGDVLGLERE